MRFASIGLVTLTSIMLGGCGSDSFDIEGAKAVTTEGTIEELGTGDRDLAKLAAETLAAELNVPIDSIEVDTVRAVEWRDSSIGCPQPGQSYLQVITPGHKITLRVGGRFHFVHEANGRAFVCKRPPKAVRGVTTELEFEWGQMALEARSDLAERLGVDEDLIIIAAAEPTTWTDNSLGCPAPGASYDARNLDGYVLTLRYGSRDYTYHTDLARVIACPPITED